MRIQRCVSEPPLTPYAPSWDFSLGRSFLPINIDALSRTCLDKEKEIKRLPLSYYTDRKIPFDGYTGLGKNSTTSRSQSINVLTWNTPETNSLKKHIKNEVIEYNKMLGNPIPEKLWAHCWVNILRWGKKIKPHLHSMSQGSYLSAHFTVQCKNTSTCYMVPADQLNYPQTVEEENEPGVLTIFPSYIPHYTTPHYSFTPRITLALDISMEDTKPEIHQQLLNPSSKQQKLHSECDVWIEL